MRHFALRVAGVAAVISLGLPTSIGSAVSSGTFKGRGASLDRETRYGKVTIKVRASKVTYLKVAAVTTSGCGGFMDVVFAPSDPDLGIVKGSARIRGGRLSVTYAPDKTVESQTTTIRARFSGGKASGTFRSGDLCVNRGRFSARK